MTSAKDRAPVGTDSSVDRGAVIEPTGGAPATRLLAASIQHERDKSPDAFTTNPKTPRGITQDPKKVNPFLQVAR
jgi:hypothetical protein